MAIKKQIYRGVIMSLLAVVCCITGCEDEKKPVDNKKDSKSYIPYFTAEPTVSSLNLEFTYAEFGSYPKTKLKKDEVTEAVVDGIYDEKDNLQMDEKMIHREKIKDNYSYYYIEPIRWKIMDVSGQEVILWSDEIVDSVVFSETEQENYKWSDSFLRQWLNQDFYNMAFTESEQELIVQKSYSNYYSALASPKTAEKNPDMLIDTTEEKITLWDAYSLSHFIYNCPYLVETTGKEMSDLFNMSEMLACATSIYALDRHEAKYESWCGENYTEDYVQYYWTKTPLDDTNKIVHISSARGGLRYMSEADYSEGQWNMGVRPVIVLPEDKIADYIVE